MTSGINGCSANEMLATIYGELKFFSHSVKNAQSLCHDFGTDAVA
jgi:hypothetical protein